MTARTHYTLSAIHTFVSIFAAVFGLIVLMSPRPPLTMLGILAALTFVASFASHYHYRCAEEIERAERVDVAAGKWWVR